MFTQIVFKDIEDYLNVREDPYYKEVVLPDLVHFADPVRSSVTIGWFEKHI